MKQRKRKNSKQFKHIEIVSPLSELALNIIVKFTFLKRCPFEINISKLSGMSFKRLDILWEKYGVCRVFNMDISTENPIFECWFPRNAIRVHSQSQFEALNQHLSSMLPPEHEKIEADQMMTLIGSTFMRAVASSTGRLREYQIYMNSVSPIHIPVGDLDVY